MTLLAITFVAILMICIVAFGCIIQGNDDKDE